MDDADINDIVTTAVRLILSESGSDPGIRVSAAMGALMWITRDIGEPDADMVGLLADMYAANPRQRDA